MKHGNQTLTMPKPQYLPPKPASTITAPPPKVEPVAMVVGSVEELLKAVSEGKVVQLSQEAKAEVEKFKTAHEVLEAPKRLAAAEAEATSELPKLLEGIAGKRKVNFSGRKVTVVFKTTPKEGEPNPLVSFGPEVEVIGSNGSKRHSSNGNGFKSGGKAVYHPEPGKEVNYNSLHAIAVDKGWHNSMNSEKQVVACAILQSEWEKADSDTRKTLKERTINRVEEKVEDGKTVFHVYPVNAS